MVQDKETQFTCHSEITYSDTYESYFSLESKSSFFSHDINLRRSLYAVVQDVICVVSAQLQTVILRACCVIL